ncbi:MAG: protein kinase [Chitinophagaceae bacterium]|nr:protein kinase [Chitinophagaceae bacterium]
MSDIKSYKLAWDKKSELSQGGQGSTIIATSKQKPDEDVVIKILLGQNDMERRARMYRESANLLTLDHPNLPKVIDTNAEYFKDKDYKLFIVTGYISGPTLSQVDYKRVELSQKISLMKEILLIVNYCHKRGVIHRDIKPDNIILQNGYFNDPVLLDFGLSFNREHADSDDLTSDGQHLGNRFLILPEQKTGETSKRDDKTDITALVGIFFYVLTAITPTISIDEYGQKPHQRKEAREIIDQFPKHQKDIINNIFDIGFNQLIDKRWQTVQSLIDQFNFLENAKLETIMEVEEVIKKIKEKANHPDYQDAKFLDNLYKEVDRKVRDVLGYLNNELGPDWSTVQSGGIIPKERAYRNMLAPYNPVIGLQMKTVIYAFINGSELIIQVIEENISKEVFREPLSNEHNWEQFKQNLKEHYVSQIAKYV